MDLFTLSTLVTLSTPVRDAFLEATFGYVIKAAVTAGRKALESIGILRKRNLYTIWENAIKDALREATVWTHPTLENVDIKRLLLDFEEGLSAIEMTPLRVSLKKPPTWLLTTFHAAILRQGKVNLRQSNKLLGFIMANVEIALEKFISENEEAFRKESIRVLYDVQHEAELLTPAMPISAEECEELERTFVPSQKYSQIEEKLAKEGFVFIVGSPNVGKSFAAKHLLFKHCYEGYEPLLVSPTSESLLLNKLLRGYEKRILLVDDVYGKYRFEPTNGRFMESLGELLKVLEVDHKLVVTSRADVLSEAHRMGRMEDIPIEEFIVEISPKDYDQETKKSILRKLMAFKDIDTKTKKLVMKHITFVVDNLHFPHNINWLVEHYLRNGLSSALELKDAVKNSVLINREIKNFYWKSSRGERIILGILSAWDDLWHLPLMTLKGVLVNLEKIFSRIYPNESLELFHNPLIALENMVDSKILISPPYYTRVYHEFYHPTYSQAFINAFVTDPAMMWALEFLCTNVPRTTASFVHAMFENFAKYPTQYTQFMRCIVSSASENVKKATVYPFFYYVEKVPLSKQLFAMLARDQIPQVKDEVFMVILRNLEGAPREIKTTFKELAKDLSIHPRDSIPYDDIADHLHKAPKELFPLFSEAFKKGTYPQNLYSLLHFFESVPDIPKEFPTILDHVQSHLSDLYKKVDLYDYYESEDFFFLLLEFDNFPSNIRSELVRLLLEDSDPRAETITAFCLEFVLGIAPIEFTNLLHGLANASREEIRDAVVEIIRSNQWIKAWIVNLNEASRSSRLSDLLSLVGKETALGIEYNKRIVFVCNCPMHGFEIKSVIVVRKKGFPPDKISVSFTHDNSYPIIYKITVGENVPLSKIVPHTMSVISREKSSKNGKLTWAHEPRVGWSDYAY